MVRIQLSRNSGNGLGICCFKHGSNDSSKTTESCLPNIISFHWDNFSIHVSLPVVISEQTWKEVHACHITIFNSTTVYLEILIILIWFPAIFLNWFIIHEQSDWLSFPYSVTWYNHSLLDSESKAMKMVVGCSS